LGKIEDIPKLVKSLAVETMIIAIPSASSRLIKRAVEMGREAGLKKIKVVPLLTEIIDGEISIENLKPLQVEDLLGREPVLSDFNAIQSFLSKKRVLVTGAAGSIGSVLSFQIAKFHPDGLLVLDRDETGIFNLQNLLKNKFSDLKLFSEIGDILDEKKMASVFNRFHPEVVFHAAAYKHVPLMEEHPGEAVKNNILGTKIISDLSLKYGVEKFIFVSTDKSVNPTSVMGATKRVGEMICQVLNKKEETKFISVRFGNVLDSRGSCIPIFREQIKKGGPLEITHPEMKRYFMTTSEACLLVMEAGAIGQGGEVFVLDMGEPIQILDLAREMIKLYGLEPDKDIPIVFTGIRPGEKLFEEILTAEEGTEATESQKILKAKLSEINTENLKSGLEKLKTLADNSDRKTIIETLKKLIPTYLPNKNIKS